MYRPTAIVAIALVRSIDACVPTVNHWFPDSAMFLNLSLFVTMEERDIGLCCGKMRLFISISKSANSFSVILIKGFVYHKNCKLLRLEINSLFKKLILTLTRINLSIKRICLSIARKGLKNYTAASLEVGPLKIYQRWNITPNESHFNIIQ